jgi:hypothetical protein
MRKVSVSHWWRHFILPLLGLLAIDIFTWVATVNASEEDPIDALMVFSLIGIIFIYTVALLEPMVIVFDTKKLCLSNPLAFWRKPQNISYKQVKRVKIVTVSTVLGNFTYLYLHKDKRVMIKLNDKARAKFEKCLQHHQIEYKVEDK